MSVHFPSLSLAVDVGPTQLGCYQPDVKTGEMLASAEGELYWPDLYPLNLFNAYPKMILRYINWDSNIPIVTMK